MAAASVWGTAKYIGLATGNADLDRYAIRGNVLIYSTLYQLDPKVVMAIVYQESKGKPENYVGDETSSHGPSIGPMQVSRDTAKDLGLWAPDPSVDEREAYAAMSEDEAQGIKWGCAVLANKLESASSMADAVRAYNGSGTAAETYRAQVALNLGSLYPGSVLA